MLEQLIPFPRMDMNELMSLLGRHEESESLLDETWTVMPIGSKVVGLGWKSPSNDFQDPRESWGDAQDTEKEE